MTTLDRVSRAVASGCYDELVEKDDITREEYIEKYAHLFVSAARKAMDELGVSEDAAG